MFYDRAKCFRGLGRGSLFCETLLIFGRECNHEIFNTILLLQSRNEISFSSHLNLFSFRNRAIADYLRSNGYEEAYSVFKKEAELDMVCLTFKNISGFT